jgi:hypothetical protein
LVDADFEVLVGFEDGLGVVDMGAGVEDGQGALAEEGVGAAGSGFAQLLTSRWERVSRLPLGLTEALITCRWDIQ